MIEGRVVDREGRPVAGAWVMLGAGSGTVRKTISDESGAYAFEKLPNELQEMKVSVHVWPPRAARPA